MWTSIDPWLSSMQHVWGPKIYFQIFLQKPQAKQATVVRTKDNNMDTNIDIGIDIGCNTDTQLQSLQINNIEQFNTNKYKYRQAVW